MLSAVAFAAAPVGALAQSGGSRRFALAVDGNEIGTHTVSVSGGGGDVDVSVAIDIQARVLGLTVYRYEHRSNERWRGGSLVSLRSTTNDNGEAKNCSVSVSGSQLSIQGSGYRGGAPLGSAPTSYWNYDALSAPRWFNSEDGRLLNISFGRDREGGLERVDVRGEISFNIFYDSNQEWRGVRFDRDGRLITYRQTAAGPRFSALV